MLHIYYGNGKGKTTAAVGLAVRAAGSGMKTAFIQFLKNGTSSEITSLRSLGIRVNSAVSCTKFTFQMNEEHNALIDEAAALVGDGFQLLVLDEFIGAYGKLLLDRDKAAELLDKAERAGCEIVLTGRDPAPELTERADYLTEMCAVRHPYEKGIAARIGIEY